MTAIKLLVNIGIICLFVFMLSACGILDTKQAEAQKGQEKVPRDTIQVSDETAQQIEIKTERIEKRVLGKNIHITGQIHPEEGRESDVNTRFSGRVVKILVRPGDFVKAGQCLAYVDSHEVNELQAELIEAKSKLAIAKAHEARERLIYQEYLLRPRSLIEARTQFESSKVHLNLAEAEQRRSASLYKEKIAAQKDYLQAEAALESARLEHKSSASQLQLEEGLFKNKAMLQRDLQLAQAQTAQEKQHLDTLSQRLESLGLPAALIQSVLKDGKIITSLPLCARSSGIVTVQDVAIGEIVEPAKTAMVITDLSRVLISADLPEVDLSSITLGSKVRVKVSSYPDREFTGVIRYISENVEPETRTVSIRALLENPDHLLKSHMFAEIDFQAIPRAVIACPTSAVQNSNEAKVVFLKTKQGYQRKIVNLGASTEHYYEVVSGLEPGDEVVTQGSLMLKTELATH